MLTVIPQIKSLKQHVYMFVAIMGLVSEHTNDKTEKNRSERECMVYHIYICGCRVACVFFLPVLCGSHMSFASVRLVLYILRGFACCAPCDVTYYLSCTFARKCTDM